MGFQIFVKTNTGNTITIDDVEPTDTIMNIKERIFHKTGLPVSKQRIVFSGKEFNNNDTVGNSGIIKESTIYIIIKLPSTVINQNTNLEPHLEYFKGLLSSFIQDNILVYMNISTPLVNINNNINISTFEKEVINSKLINHFRESGLNIIKLFLFNPEYNTKVIQLKKKIEKITKRVHNIIHDPHFIIIKDPDPDQILDVYISKFNLHHLTNLHPDVPNVKSNKTLFNYLNDEFLFRNLNIFYKLYNNEYYYLKLKNSSIEIFPYPNLFNHYVMSGGRKRLIRTGPKGGKYYIKNGKKIYIK